MTVVKLCQPLETTFSQAFVVEPEAGSAPPQNVDFIPLPAAEHKQAAGQGIRLKTFADNNGKPVIGLAHIRRSCHKINRAVEITGRQQ